MSGYSGSRFILNGGVVNNHTVINKQIYRESVLTMLLEQSHPDAFHNSKMRSPPVTCYKGTRTPVLKAIVKSDEHIRTLSHPFLWLSGHPGAGKSTIAQTIAEDLFKSKSLAAAYFFPSWCGGDRVIATITYQLIQNIPAIRPFVEDAIECNPGVFHLSLHHQAQELILEPFCRLRKAVPGLDVSILPRVIIVDGLDNCATTLVPLLNALSHLVCAQETFPFTVLVTSDDSVAHWFQRHSETIRLYPTTHHGLNDNNKDISRFVTDSLKEIVECHPRRHLLPTGWASQELIRAVIYRAAGQFVTAKTIMHHIRQPECVPSYRLHNILDSGEANEYFPERRQNDDEFLLLQALLLSDDHTWDSHAGVTVSVGSTSEDCFDGKDFDPLNFDSLGGPPKTTAGSLRGSSSKTTTECPPKMIAASPYETLQPSLAPGSPFEFIQPSPASLPILIQPSSNFSSPFEVVLNQYRR
ncbi:hypothetical protein BJ165DRAFT_1405567 [Panaeolus papilionaceus]|nr:hypothetical protein BJ165DRAFT_1405567 [Panaeolus papilionaceus]